MSEDKLLVVENFLTSYWHQDAGSDIEVLQEFFDESENAYRYELTKLIEEFISADINNLDKNRFIESCVDNMDFSIMKVDPLAWLESVLVIIKNGKFGE